MLFGKYDKESFTEWNRILWNICENRVDKSNLEPTMSEIDLLAPQSHDILEYLSQEKAIDCKQNKEQLLEEQRKARHLNEFPIIKDLEGYMFFKGAIRFLYTGSDNNEDWNSFENKAQNIKVLIPEKREERHTFQNRHYVRFTMITGCLIMTKICVQYCLIVMPSRSFIISCCRIT